MNHEIIIKHEYHNLTLQWFILQDICMSCTNYSIHTYPKHEESTKEYAWRHVAQGCTCINDSLDKIDIYMKSYKTCKMKNTSQMQESSKLDYTSTSSEYKWAFKHKHI